MNEKVNKAYSILGTIKRNFIYLYKEPFVLLYKATVRPQCYQSDRDILTVDGVKMQMWT